MNNRNEYTMNYTLSTPVTVLKGVGETRVKSLLSMGVETLGDLVRCFPRAYQNRGDTVLTTDIKEKLSPGESGIFSLILTVSSEPSVRMIRRGMTVMKFSAFDEGGAVHITYFNQPYLKNTMHTGSVFRFFGKVTRENGALTMANPISEPYYSGAVLQDIVPVYPLSAGIKQKFMAGIV